MSYCCSQCDFTSNFESALMMHRQLHHESPRVGRHQTKKEEKAMDKSNTTPRTNHLDIFNSTRDEKRIKYPGRTSSATRLFNTIKSKICKSKLNLFMHPEERGLNFNDDLMVPSECTSKALKLDYTYPVEELKEVFACHLCSFEADRITVLDRHLLNDHQIGLDNLLKLVMAKTQERLTEEQANVGYVRQPYYKTQDDIHENEEFIIETVSPKIKILKHAAVNTDRFDELLTFKGKCVDLTRELEELVQSGPEVCETNELVAKMRALNMYMCKFADSSNMLKKVLNKQFATKYPRGSVSNNEEPIFNLGLGDQSPRDWEKAFSEKVDRPQRASGEKSKLNSESLYF